VLSVVVCTHNPLPHFLASVLKSLKKQTLPFSEWELLVIDNLSAPPLSERFDLSWHPNGRFIVEQKLGLTYARWAGFRESRGDPVIYVDDDNVLAPDYLEEVGRLAGQYPFLGAWGGQILMEFEKPPTAEEQPYTSWQLHREFSAIKWMNCVYDFADVPSGAGLAVRRSVLETHMAKLSHDPLRLKLGRAGALGGCGEDTDIVLTGLEIGLGMGLFPSLVLRHLTPSSRLTLKYCLAQSYGLGYSTVILDRIRNVPASVDDGSPIARARVAFHYWKMSPLNRSAYRSRMEGRRDALKMLREFDASNGRA
jgi:glycosyltransferase involved in cell wall biosynthesis